MHGMCIVCICYVYGMDMDMVWIWYVCVVLYGGLLRECKLGAESATGAFAL